MPYAERRAGLHQRLASDDGVILWLGATLQARNYPANPYMPFRQDSHFLYYTGLRLPGLAVLSYPDGREVLFGHPVDMDTIVWEGEQPSLKALAESAGIAEVQNISELSAAIEEVGGAVLYTAPYLSSAVLNLSSLLKKAPEQVAAGASAELALCVAAQRSCKTAAEVEQIERALGLTAGMFHEAMAMTQPGQSIASVLGHLSMRVRGELWDFSFPPILTTHGEILHTHDYGGKMEDGTLFLMDMGVETELGYASDITRTWPVNGRFTTQQWDIYDLVLQAQQASIAAIAPGVTYREVHLTAAKTIAGGLSALGLMKGEPEEAVAAGAHALFFPHGVGHMLGADVHDMEDLGDVVGYLPGEQRSSQFGLNFLRLARPLEEGYVVTVEPGIYFIPALFQMWRQDNKHSSFIDYDNVEKYLGLGGIRIEDDVLVTSSGGRVLGEPIAKSIHEIEAKVGSQAKD